MHERKIANKAIILSRVSSKDQEDGYSIDAQKYRLQEYCSRKGLEILKTFEFVESSTVGKRIKFMEAIDFAKKQKEIIAVVVDKVDRLQRSYKETPLLNDLIEKGKIELHFYTENCIIHKNATSQERMMWNLFVMLAQNYTDSSKDNINRGIAQKIRNGEWTSTAPVGYLHVKGNKAEKKKGTIVIDPERSPLIKKLFEAYATGNHTVLELLRKTEGWGLTNSRGNKGYLSKTQIYKLLQNPFYYGVMRVLKTGKQYPHKYPPIISKELFDSCQKVRLGWNRKPYKYREKEYIFRGLIKCANTGRVVTADTKKKTYASGKTGEWAYLRIWNLQNQQKAVYIREERILKEVEKVFKSMQLKPELLKEIQLYIKDSANAEKDYHKQRLSVLYAEDTKVKTRVDRLMDLYLDGELDKTTHEEKHLQLIQKKEEIIREIEAHHKADNSFTKTLISLIELASNAFDTFTGSTVDGKRNLVNLVFANLELNSEKLDYNLRPPFNSFVNLSENVEWWRQRESNP
nr:recombinase family protein [Rickettsia endosymbiont of Ceutorhynchus assimilis]